VVLVISFQSSSEFKARGIKAIKKALRLFQSSSEFKRSLVKKN